MAKTAVAKVQEKERVLKELMETAIGLSQNGMMSKKDLDLITQLCEAPPAYPPEKVVALRTNKAKMSQSVFAAVLNVSVSTVQKWESESSNKHPTGAAAKLLQLVEKKGIEAIMALG